MMCGDFNNLDMSEITNMYQINQTVTFATRENNALSHIFTDIGGYKTAGSKREPPILTTNHCAITLQSATHKRPPNLYKDKYKEDDNYSCSQECVTSTKYLGLIISNDLSWKKHI